MEFRTFSKVALAFLFLLSDVNAREWTSRVGTFKIQAKLVEVKDRRAYLENLDGEIIPVLLTSLSQADLDYLQALPELKDYFSNNPLPLEMKTRVGVSVAYEFKAGKDWADREGAVSMHAELVVIKKGNAYLEKPTGEIVAMPLVSLCQRDLDYLQALPELNEYFVTNPLPLELRTRVPRVEFHDDDSIVGLVRHFKSGSSSIGFFPNGRYLMAIWDEQISVFDLTTTEQVFSTTKVRYRNTCFTFTPNGKTLLTGGDNGLIQIWDVALNGHLTSRSRFIGHNSRVHAIAISSDSRFVLSGDESKRVRCWNIEDARERFVLDGFERDAIRSTHITPSGKQGLATDGLTVALIDMETGKIVQDSRLPRSDESAVISPDGRIIGTCDSRSLHVFEIQSGNEYLPIEDLNVRKPLAFSPNGKYLASVSSNGKTLIWNPYTRRKVAEFDAPKPNYGFTNITFSPDNRYYALGNQSEVHVFRLPAERTE